jgi:hypothetical protein
MSRIVASASFQHMLLPHHHLDVGARLASAAMRPLLQCGSTVFVIELSTLLLGQLRKHPSAARDHLFSSELRQEAHSPARRTYPESVFPHTTHTTAYLTPPLQLSEFKLCSTTELGFLMLGLTFSKMFASASPCIIETDKMKELELRCASKP